MRALQLRRRVRTILLRGLRVVRRHHLTLVSLAVLGVVFVVALTSSGFEVDGGSRSPAEAANSPPTVIPTNVPLAVTTFSERVEVYYIVDSVDQIDQLKNARRNDAVYLAHQNLPPLPSIDIYFLLFDSPETESIGAHFLSQLAESAPYEGFRLEIVDLTR